MQPQSPIGATGLVAALRQYVPNTITLAACEADAPAAPLLGGELAIADFFALPRRHEFALGRACARTALRLLDGPAIELLRGQEGQPVWPTGYCGSITHSRVWCIAAAARRVEVRSVGIDTEETGDVPDTLLPRIASAAECRHGERLWPDGPPTTALFVAKEAVFKAHFGATGERLGFADVAVWLEPEHCAFSTSISPRSLPSRHLDGVLVRAGGTLAAVVVVP